METAVKHVMGERNRIARNGDDIVLLRYRVIYAGVPAAVRAGRYRCVRTACQKGGPRYAYAKDGRGGLNPLDPLSIGRRIDEIKRERSDAFVIVFPHWGLNYKWRTKRQARLAQELLSAGADMIVGHGAHMLQEIEKQHGHWIIYSLGNFMFNSHGRYAQYNAPPYSLVGRLVVEPEGDGLAKRLQLLPIVTDNRLTDFRPRPVTEAEFAEVTSLLEHRFSSPEIFSNAVRRSCDATGLFNLELCV